MATKKELQKVEPAGEIMIPDYGEDAGKGFEYQTSADAALPFIVLCQPNTPMVVNRQFGLQPGDFFNTVTEQTWAMDEGLLFVPATTRHYYAKWVPRVEGGGAGGFRGHLEIDDPIVERAIKDSKQFGKYFIDDERDGKLQLRETFYVYGVTCSEDGKAEGMAIMAFWSTKIRSYKAWQSRMKPYVAKRVPMFAHLTRITSTMQKNDQGTFFVQSIRSGDPRGMAASLLTREDERYQMAKVLGEMVASGTAKTDFNKQAAAGDDDDVAPFE